MKIAILGTRGVPAQYGGFETFAEELAIRLAAASYDVTVYCEHNCYEHRLPSYKGIKLEYIKTPKLGPLTTIFVDLFSIWGARKKFDIIYMLGYGGSPFFFIPRLYGKKVWVNMDGIEWKRSKWSTLAKVYLKFTEKIAMISANKIIADAQGIYTDLSNRYKHNFACSVIAYGAYVLNSAPSVDILNAFGLTQNNYYLIVCRLEPENHILEMVKGYLASNSTKPLIILGNKNSGTKYVNELVKYDNDRVKFIGTIYNEERLQALRFYCFAYFHGHSVGGTNPSLLEAMGASNIVIAHKNCFNQEVLGESAFYFDQENQVAKIISELENNYAKYQHFKENVRNIIIERYSWEIITQQYINEIKYEQVSK